MSMWDGIKVALVSLWAKLSIRPEPLPPPMRSFVDVEDPPVFIDRYAERNSTPGATDVRDKVLQAVSNIKAGVR